MRKMFIFTGMAFLCVAVLFQNIAQSTLPLISYQLANPTLWHRDLTVDVDMEGAENYDFEKSEEIDLNILPVDADLAESLRTRGLDQFLEDVLLGKNMINRIFGIDDVILVSHSLTNENGAQILRLKTKQVIDLEQFLIDEKYIIYQGQALNLQLRWSETVNQDQLRRAQQSFEQIAILSRVNADQ